MKILIENIFKKEWLLIAAILLLAIVTRFYHFGQPAQIVFDEVHFAKFTNAYFKGEYYFDIHPPLAKLLMAGWAKLLNKEPPASFAFDKIGEAYPNDFYKSLRLLVSFFGVILPLAVYFLAKELFKNKWPAFFAGLLVVFENAILVQSRFALIDVFLLVFGVGGLVFFLIHRRKKHCSAPWFVYLVLAALFFSAALSVKWTALIFLALAGLILLIDFFREKRPLIFGVQTLILLFVVFLFYFGVFVVHLQNLPYSGGTADNFMSPGFQKTLIGNQYFSQCSMPRVGTN